MAGDSTMARSKLDLIVYGASSFVGQLLARELLLQFGADGDLRWALAGRSRDKLEALRTQLGTEAQRLPILLADAADPVALHKLVGRARAVVSTVGPYALHGEPLLRACVERGTDYCDLTGETPWVQRMISSYEAAAQASGARIVHCCGFDSIPSDLGVWVLQDAAQRQYGEPLSAVQMRVARLSGGFSGGTVASVLNVLREAVADPKVRRGLADPYWLCPAPRAGETRPRQPDTRFARYDAQARSWIAPFIMSGINTRVVQRSHALSQSNLDLTPLLYDEALLTGAGFSGRLKAIAISTALAGFLGVASLPPSRWLLQRWFLPQPGNGPTPQAQQAGGYELRFDALTRSGRTLQLTLRGERDPGYGSTARMLAQASRCLALDTAKADYAGGFWTPATLLGGRLVERLQQHAGLSFELKS
jgi:short subunit dehydrogenase-like uncharacterized protein